MTQRRIRLTPDAIGSDGAGTEPQAEETAGEAGRQPERPLDVDRLAAELEAVRTRADEHLADLQRALADFANFRRRTHEERDATVAQAGERLIRKILPIADDFDRAIEAMPETLRDDSWVQGVVAIDRKLRLVLEGEGVRPIEALGQPFDPRQHEAVANVPGSGRPDGEVVAEVQRGYHLGERVLRPALVAVASGGGPPAVEAADGPPDQPPTPHPHRTHHH